MIALIGQRFHLAAEMIRRDGGVAWFAVGDAVVAKDGNGGGVGAQDGGEGQEEKFHGYGYVTTGLAWVMGGESSWQGMPEGDTPTVVDFGWWTDDCPGYSGQ